MWIQFATMLRHALFWLVRRRAWLPLAGALGGPLAYLSGERMGAVAFGPALGPTLLALGVGWAIAMPVLGAIAGTEPGRYRWTGHRPESRSR